jgi:hypothetical protein
MFLLPEQVRSIASGIVSGKIKFYSAGEAIQMNAIRHQLKAITMEPNLAIMTALLSKPVMDFSGRTLIPRDVLANALPNILSGGNSTKLKMRTRHPAARSYNQSACSICYYSYV